VMIREHMSVSSLLEKEAWVTSHLGPWIKQNGEMIKTNMVKF
jgi:hypothetical protein